MIVVEGPDGSGKTTLVQDIKHKFPGLEQFPRAVNSDAEYGAPLDAWVEHAAQRDEELGGRLIVDRHQLISHLMYGPVMRRQLYSEFTNPAWLHQTTERFWRADPMVILCLPDLPTVKANLAKDEHKVAEADIDIFWWNYYIWFAQNMGRVWVYHFNYETDSRQFLMDRIHNRYYTEVR